jgi:hypothetical protein
MDRMLHLTGSVNVHGQSVTFNRPYISMDTVSHLTGSVNFHEHVSHLTGRVNFHGQCHI